MIINRRYTVTLDLSLDSIWDHEPPQCQILFDDTMFFDDTVKSITQLRLQKSADPGTHSLCIKYYNKSHSDLKQSIQIKSIKLNSIEDSRFIWAGVYCPTYPEPWASQQRQQGAVLLPTLNNTDYLGWAGTWTLTFDVPIFTWIHKTTNLGTIYD
jgi:hypothetical protein